MCQFVWSNSYFFDCLYSMAPKRRVTKRKEPKVVPDAGSAQMESQEANSPPGVRQRVTEPQETIPLADFENEFRMMR